MTPETVAQALVSGLAMGSVYALVAVGLALIWSLMNMVNFAHGQFVMLGMFGSFGLYALFGMDPLLSLPLVAVAVALLGGLVYWVAIRPVLRAPVLAQILVTFGLMLLLQNTAQFLWSPNLRLIDHAWAQGRISLLGLFLPKALLVAGVAALLSFAALYWFVSRTEPGRALRATAQDRQAAELMGINTARVDLLGWGLAAGSAGTAGVLLSNFFYISPQVGLNFVLVAFVVVALGGFGSVVGAFVAAMIVGVTEAIAGLVFEPSLKYAVVYAIYFLVVFFRPRGLLGRY